MLEYLSLSGLDRLWPPVVALLANRLPNLRTLEYDRMIQAWIYSVVGTINRFIFKALIFREKVKVSLVFENL
jgi:hypothetical protein